MQLTIRLLLKTWLILASLLEVPAEIQSNQTWMKSSSNFKAMEGFPFDMSCEIFDEGSSNIKILLPNGEEALTNEEMSLIRNTNANKIELEIIKANQTRDEGTYRCVKQGHVEGKMITESVEVNVTFTSQPFLNISSPTSLYKVNIELNTTAIVTLDYEALPRPTFSIRSFHSRKNIEITDLRGHLQYKILNVDITDAGNFKLYADNVYLKSNLSVEMVVEGRPKVIYSELPRLIATPSCKFERRLPWGWNSIADFSLFDGFKNVTTDFFAPITNLGDGVELDFTLVSVPSAEISWIFQPCSQDHTLAECRDDGIYNYKNFGGTNRFEKKTEYFSITIFPNHPGYLYIVAKNEHGQFNLKLAIGIQKYAPELITIKTIYNRFTRLNEILVGEDLEFECKFSLNNKRKIVWYFNREIMNQNTSLKHQSLNERYEFGEVKTSGSCDFVQKLVVRNANVNDSGRYTCMNMGEPENYFYTTKVDIAVIAKEPPRIKTNFDASLTLQIGQSLTLECNITNFSRLRGFNWYKVGQRLDQDKTSFVVQNSPSHIKLSSRSLTSNDSGQYLCVAINDFGNDTQYVDIKFENDSSKYLITFAVIVILIVAILGLYIKILLEKKTIQELMEAGIANFKDGNPNSFNPDLNMNEQADLLPYDNRFEFPLEKLMIGEQLGSGAFGVVYKAVAKGIENNKEAVTIVAVKTISKLAPNEMLKALVVELKIMVHLGQHLNVVNLLGAITKNIAKRDLMVICEFCHHGDLERFLRKNRAFFDNSQNLESVPHSTKSVKQKAKQFMNVNKKRDESCSKHLKFESNQRFDTSNLISWSFQVARGMDYLSSKKVLHGDLAARNVLLCDGDIVKIGDFGLAKSLYKNYKYQRKEDALLPYKWLALESLIDNSFTVHSDIWAYGVFLWEIFTLGQTPYPEVSGIESLLEKLQSGYRLKKSGFVTDNVYNIMLNCWKESQSERPTFAELEHRFEDLIDEEVKNHIIELNKPMIEANKESLQKGRIDFANLTKFEHKQEIFEVGDQTAGTSYVGRSLETSYRKPSQI